MPTYTYQCKEPSCGNTFEKKQSMHDDKLTFCEQCSHESLERIIVPAGFILKGGGWFKDGYSGSDK